MDAALYISADVCPRRFSKRRADDMLSPSLGHRDLILIETISRLPYIYELCSSVVASGDLCRTNFVIV
jgi:hypothetical protein